MKEIDQKINECDVKLQQLGPTLPRDSKERMHLIWNMLTEYTETFKNQIKGKYDSKNKITNKEMVGGAKIKSYLIDLYGTFSK